MDEMKRRRPFAAAGLKEEQNEHDMESVKLFTEHVTGKPGKDYDDRRKKVRERLKRLKAAEQADAIEKY